MALQLQLARSENIAVVVGVTDGSANTNLSTKPPNPFGHVQVLAIPMGEGVYVEDDGSVRPRQSGVEATTIDVRSSTTSAAFVCLCVALGPGEALTRDHSGTTT